MIFTIERSDPAVIALAGEVLGGPDALEFTQAISEIVREGTSRLIVDMTDVPIVNSSGLGMLVNASTSLRSAGGRLAVSGANAKIRSLLKMTRLDTVFPSFDTREEAAASLRQD